MTRFEDMDTEELGRAKAALDEEYARIKARNLTLDMARGKPSAAQLDLSMGLLDDACRVTRSEGGMDCRNYGVVDGLPETKRLMAVLLDDEPERVVVLGNSSLSAMYDAIGRCWAFGTLGSTPWCKLPEVKWLCPAPGYDRHFGVTEAFGIQMITVPMTPDGPDMDVVEALVADDAAVKGIWCIPKYSNPSGVTYSDETVRRLASMSCAADDFRIFWDNAYCVHHLFDEPENQDELLDIAKACEQAGTQDRYFKFASTSKITFPGAGIAAFAASERNVAEVTRRLGAQTIGHDKLNQLRHVAFLRDAQGIAEHMSRHAALLRPKFELVERKLADGLAEVGGCSWNSPRGGYFVSFDAPQGCAKRIVALAKEAGVTLTGAGASFPYGNDPRDSNIRIAPTMPPLEELAEALDVFVCCVKLAAVEKLLG